MQLKPTHTKLVKKYRALCSQQGYCGAKGDSADKGANMLQSSVTRLTGHSFGRYVNLQGAVPLLDTHPTSHRLPL